MKALHAIVIRAGALAPLSAAAEDEAINVAFLAASSQNGFNQAIYAGIASAAEAYETVSTEIFDGESRRRCDLAFPELLHALTLKGADLT